MFLRPIFYLFFLLLTNSLRGQTSIGLEGGFSSNSFSTAISNRVSTKIFSGKGFDGTLSVRHRLFPWLYITATPTLLQKNYSIERTDSFYGIGQHYRNTFVQLPIGLSLVYGKRFRVSIDPGLYLGYWLSGRVEGGIANIFGVIDSTGSSGQTTERFPISNYNESYQFQNRRDNRWQLGWVLGVGAQYRVSGNYWLVGNTRYYRSLTSQEKSITGMGPSYNATWTFSAGVMWEIGNH
jgi:hypothetical protein